MILRLLGALRTWLLVATAVVMASCSTSPQAPKPQPLPPPSHAYQVAQLERPGGNAAYVTCNDCPAPTRKTLPGADKRPAAPAPRVAVQAAPPPEPRPPRLFASVLQFNLNSAKLTAPARAQMDSWAAVLRLSTHVQVTGFTDDLGGPRLNARLSEARSQVVLSALRERLDGRANAPPMSSTGRSLCCYVSDNRGEAHRRANRRAEVHITVPDGPDLVQALKALPLTASLGELGSQPAAPTGDARTNARTAARTTAHTNAHSNPTKP